MEELLQSLKGGFGSAFLGPVEPIYSVLEPEDSNFTLFQGASKAKDCSTSHLTKFDRSSGEKSYLRGDGESVKSLYQYSSPHEVIISDGRKYQ